ncbi:MAG: M20/M25/M40 family metallo-hydrolase [Gammaproteobacteria bacterium]|nr:M20/M25/M40 family metallo-hydrolase [Gammaproteobacteria bacterium]MDH4254970.1 M20/M25/M40 family metallo-hydrolase [Gammaproteobacteria bacterium]MDH5310215.1 M20/M25/M40 family metallo-hydrolase [Gammaproteobacteria bacterium]
MKYTVSAALLLLPAIAAAQSEYLVDWDEAGDEAIGYMVDLVRIDSSNPPGNETEVANYIRDVLASEGIASEMYALDPDRGNLVARIRGNGSKRPILIMGHTDVVGVQADKWSEDPFGAVRKDGYIWGRGTLDDKDNVTAGIMVMLLLKRLEVELDRDIIFLAESGEEGTPEVGINYMVEHHWDKIAAEYCIAEGGGMREEGGEVRMVGVQTTEKKPRRATLVARGTAGHGSLPRTDNAVVMIAEAVAKVGRWQTPVRLNDTTRAYFERMASISGEDAARRYGSVEDPAQAADVDSWFRENDPFHYSTLRTSVVPTIIDAGFRKNVVPSEGSAVLDIRMLPDENVEAFYQELAKVIDNPAIEIVPEPIYRPEAPPSGIDNEMFQTIERVAKRMYPNSTTIPVMATGATDMAQIRSKGTEAYGIGPARTLEEINSRFGAHSDDERISEESLKEMVRFLWNIIVEVGATK